VRQKACTAKDASWSDPYALHLHQNVVLAHRAPQHAHRHERARRVAAAHADRLDLGHDDAAARNTSTTSKWVEFQKFVFKEDRKFFSNELRQGPSGLEAFVFKDS
jgi:hypothetical protein